MATQKEPISVPAMKTVKENPKEMETFLCHLQKKEFFDIVNIRGVSSFIYIYYMKIFFNQKIYEITTYKT